MKLRIDRVDVDWNRKLLDVRFALDDQHVTLTMDGARYSLNVESVREAARRNSFSGDIPPGWERCGADCPDAGKWGTGLDPFDPPLWELPHRWLQRPPNGGFVIHRLH